MEVKKIVEGMTAPEVAQVIDENFKALNNEKANKSVVDAKFELLVNMSNQLETEKADKATTEENFANLEETIATNKESADTKLSELGSKVDVILSATYTNRIQVNGWNIRVVDFIANTDTEYEVFIKTDGSQSQSLFFGVQDNDGNVLKQDMDIKVGEKESKHFTFTSNYKGAAYLYVSNYSGSPIEVEGSVFLRGELEKMSNKQSEAAKELAWLDNKSNIPIIVGLAEVGTIFGGQNDSSNVCVRFNDYFQVEGNETIKLYAKDNLTLRISEYNDSKIFLNQIGYSDIKELTLQSDTRYIRLSCNYEGKGYSDNNPIRISDYSSSDFGFYRDYTYALSNTKEKVVRNELKQNCYIYFGSGYAPKFSLSSGTYTIEFPNSAFKLYNDEGKEVVNISGYASQKFEIPHGKRLVCNITNKTIYVTDFEEKDNLMTLFVVSTSRVIGGLLLPYFQNQKNKEVEQHLSDVDKELDKCNSFVYYAGGYSPTFSERIIGTNQAEISVTFTSGAMKIYKENGDLFKDLGSSYASQTFIVSHGKKLVYDIGNNAISVVSYESTGNYICLLAIAGKLSVGGILLPYYDNYKRNEISLDSGKLYYGQKFQIGNRFISKFIDTLECGSNYSLQGGCVLGNYYIQFFDSFNQVSIYKVSDMTKVGLISLSSQDCHCNNVQVTSVKYDDSDAFPMILVSFSAYGNDNKRGAYLYRVQQSGSDWSFTKIQTINYPSRAELDIHEPHATLDNENGFLYLSGYSVNDGTNANGNTHIRLAKFHMPTFDKSVQETSINITDRIGDVWEVSKIQGYCQDTFSKNGYIYIAIGASNDGKIWMIDPSVRDVVSVINLTDANITEEPEGIDSDGKYIYLSTLGSKLYRIQV